jgi:putative ABC transport system ATP-binding protein
MTSAQSTLLQMNGVSRTYGEGRSAVYAVRSIDLLVASGEIVAVVGPSGSGKTTLLSIAGCLLRPTAGVVSLLGKEVTGLSQSTLASFRRRHIGFVFQSFNLLPPLSARENIEIALNIAGVSGEAAHERSTRLLDLLELGHLTNRVPGDMSGGEQQRLAVARALANRPDIILADEPTASLDSRVGRKVMQLMRAAIDAGESRGLVVVTHDTRILDIADRVILMEDGQLRPEQSRASTSGPVSAFTIAGRQ